ncbi:5'-methylthioadenosine/adenosylhomocysteine nucleosidase [Ideonella sp. 4Y16]|uniref:adenosylhomocysteine nucleosidase n=1 Tax=Ideonella alba TaxID=2824118 RepID=A0A940YJ78_9BURK|nr:5'-methylthioadenosine/adenosylhomocysteine nucleosidase [Ideonella alba]MBQ0933402.1 5'-methylthioadenosine/adenosylhomocysteine nucleosidase [Ideonella alba]MBQ0943553.1 5'-methylthioadenosine/adenosylhomocysteine nucleosidase [Ideonella alba]
MTLAIVSALPDELAALQARLDVDHVSTLAGRRLHRGRLAGHDVILVLSGIGKVAAATTAALLLDRFDVQALLFTGVAGGLGPGVAVGDVVVGRQFLQHDMDASPLFPRWEVPMTGRSRFDADGAWSARLVTGAAAVLAAEHPALASFGIAAPRVHQGLVVSGDRFVSSAAECARLQAELPDALAVEMEGAALAQVAHDFGRPCAVLRTISDRADDAAHVDFPRFLREVAAEYARDIVLAALAA